MEWDEGKIRADNLLASKDSVRMYADRLTELAVALGFDGWLVSLHISYVLSQLAFSRFILVSLSHYFSGFFPFLQLLSFDVCSVV